MTNFANLGELHAAWKARYEYNRERADDNDISCARAAAYLVGVGVLEQHLDGIGTPGREPDFDLFGSVVTRKMAPEFLGAKMPAQVLPYLLGCFSGAVAVEMKREGESASMVEQLAKTHIEMSLELFDTLYKMSEAGRL